MTWLVKLYPKAWRDRYEREFATLLAGRRSPRLALDIIAGAIDAWVEPQVRVNGLKVDRGDQIMKLLTARCSETTLTAQERTQGFAAAIVATLATLVFYVSLKRIFGKVLAVEAVGLAVFPFALMVATMPAYLRGHSLAARLGLMVLLAILIYLGALFAVWS